MVPSVRLRQTTPITTARSRSESMWWCQLSSIFRIFLCIGMVPMIFPESEALRTNLSHVVSTATMAALTDTTTYYDYTTTSSASASICIVRHQLQMRDSFVCPLLMRPRSIGSLIDAAHSIGRIRTQFQQHKTHRYFRNRYFVNDPVFAIISWIVAVASSSCILLWSRFYRWKFTILIGLATLHVASSMTFSSLFKEVPILLRIFGSWYMRNLHTNPIITKSISAGLIGTIADYGAQWLEHILHQQKLIEQPPLRLTASTSATTNDLVVDHDTYMGNPDQQQLNQNDDATMSPSASLFTTISIYGRYDIRRGMSTLMDGLFISGPLMHIGYDWFESIFPINTSHAATSSSSSGGGGDTTGWFAAILHVIADSVLLDSFFVASKFFTTGLMEGITVHDLLRQFYSTYIPSLQASWITSILLCPIQLSCFCYLPLSFRVLSVNIIDVVWDAVLSFMTHRNR